MSEYVWNCAWCERHFKNVHPSRCGIPAVQRVRAKRRVRLLGSRQEVQR